VRIPYGEEPDPASHLLALAPHHGYYHSGISEILTLDPTIRQNPQALLQLCKGALAIQHTQSSPPTWPTAIWFG
jgi:hypothetical protein